MSTLPLYEFVTFGSHTNAYIFLNESKRWSCSAAAVGFTTLLLALASPLSLAQTAQSASQTT
jgi:hypothetical protein